MKSLVVIFFIGAGEGNDQAKHRFKQTVSESNAIMDNNLDEAGRVHRQSTNHPDGIMVKDCGLKIGTSISQTRSQPTTEKFKTRSTRMIEDQHDL